MSKDDFKGDFKDYLIKEGIALPDVLNEILREQDKTHESLLDILIHSGRFDEKKFVSSICHRYGFTSVNPSVFLIEPEVLSMISKEVAEKRMALPISLYENTLTVAFANPTNIKVVDEIRSLTGKRIKVAVAEASKLKACIEKYYSDAAAINIDAKANGNQSNGAQPNVEEKGLDELVKMIENEHENEGAQGEDLLKVAYETPVIKLVNMVLIEGVRRKASDIFIEPWEKHVRVRARVDGLLEEVIKAQKSAASAMVSRVKVMSELDIAEHRIPQDGRFKIKINGREVDMRVSILPTSFGEKVCLRILDTTAQSHELSKLGFDESEQVVIKDSARRPHGMILVTGPTGSGKTTTLYSVLKYLDNPEVNITTVEDPVEYQLPGINQVNVKDSIGLTFPSCLRSILRQDPDIILIGEIRDAATLDIAVKAALTGHLVLSTLHTNDAASSVTRMMNMGLEPFLIASTVLMISAQRLVRRLCPKCRHPVEIDRKALEDLGIEMKKGMEFFEGRGCVQCRQTGYKGRTVITEIMEMEPQVRELVMKGTNSSRLKAFGREKGMKTLRESAIQKALEGETSLEEVFRVTGEEASAKKQTETEDEASSSGEKEAA